jgi:hypothetical protein
MLKEHPVIAVALFAVIVPGVIFITIFALFG